MLQKVDQEPVIICNKNSEKKVKEIIIIITFSSYIIQEMLCKDFKRNFRHGNVDFVNMCGNKRNVILRNFFLSLNQDLPA